MRLSCETEFSAATSEFCALAATLARTSAELGSARVAEVVAATLDTRSGLSALEQLQRRCGEQLRVDKLELFDQAPAVVAVALLDHAQAAVLVQLFYARETSEDRDLCARLASTLLLAEDAARSVEGISGEGLRERWAVSETWIDKLTRSHAPHARWVRCAVRWS